MSFFELTATLLTLSATFGWLNHQFLHLPHSVGLLLLGLLSSLLLIVVDLAVPQARLYEQVVASLGQIDFTEIVINGMLAFLLFAGALNVNFSALRSRALQVGYLAIVATIVSTAVVGGLVWYTAGLLGFPVSLPWALVFGALISPTDPVAVLTMLKGMRLKGGLKSEAEGEALFNDGVGIVLFTVLVGVAVGHESFDLGAASLDLLREAGGGIVLGLGTGYLAYRAMRAIDDFPVEVLITLALVGGTYALAQRLGFSGALATVAAGLLVGERAPKDAMSERTQTYVTSLWTLIDEVLNSVLFLLIGLELFVVQPNLFNLLFGLVAIPIVLVARVIAVSIPLLLPLRGRANPRHVPFLTWAGVRGGISVALVLALPASEAKPVLLAGTYAVVLFSVVVQGLTLRPLVRRLGLSDDRGAGGGGTPSH
ncbi:MAG: sodium:proton antiporter [Devosia sp.]